MSVMGKGKLELGRLPFPALPADNVLHRYRHHRQSIGRLPENGYDGPWKRARLGHLDRDLLPLLPHRRRCSPRRVRLVCSLLSSIVSWGFCILPRGLQADPTRTGRVR